MKQKFTLCLLIAIAVSLGSVFGTNTIPGKINLSDFNTGGEGVGFSNSLHGEVFWRSSGGR